MNKIDIGRRAGRVIRYHTTPTLVREDIAQHTFNVMNLLMVLTEGAPSPNLMRYALLHDQGEYVTGDIPSTVKRSVSSIKKVLDDMEASAIPFALPELSDWEYRIFKTADNLDGLIKCMEEVRMGNHIMVPIGLEYCKYLRQLWEGDHGYAFMIASEYINKFSEVL